MKTKKVFFLSVKEPTADFVEAIYQLHGPNCEIKHVPLPMHGGPKLVRALQYCQDGFCYIVADRKEHFLFAQMLEYASSMGFRFGVFGLRPVGKSDGSPTPAVVFYIDGEQLNKVWFKPDAEADQGVVIPAAMETEV